MSYSHHITSLTHVIECLVVEGRGVAGPVDKEEATEDNDGHGEEDSTIEHMLMQTECSNHLKIIYNLFLEQLTMKMTLMNKSNLTLHTFLLSISALPP